MVSLFEEYKNGFGRRYSNAQILNEYSKEVLFDGLKKTFQVVEFSCESGEFSFYSSKSAGFLSKKALNISSDILPAHLSILEEIGTIQELYNVSSEYIENLEGIFTYREDTNVFESMIADIKEKALEEAKETQLSQYVEKINTMTIFAYEANGNCFMYDSQGEVYLYANDHSYSEIVALSLWPEYTLYQIPSIKTFDEFVTKFFESIK